MFRMTKREKRMTNTRNRKTGKTKAARAVQYDEYRMTGMEKFKYMAVFCALAGLISYLFYDSWYAVIALIPAGFLFMKRIRTELMDKKRAELRRQFQDMIDSVSSALAAGYSVENAFYEARKDMIRLYGHDSLITVELDHFFSMLENGQPFENILGDFAKRADVEDITDFSEIFVLAKRNGGDFKGIIGKTVRIMKEKDETEKDIRVILAGRRYEQRIMCIIPFGIILYLKLSSGNFLQVLYHNPAGIAVMTVCLAIYMGSYMLSRKIIDIRV